MFFGETLRQLRESRGMAVSALAREAKTERSNLSRIEKGTRGVPTYDTLSKIAKTLDLSGEERRRMMEAAIADMIEGLLAQWSIYYYALISEGGEEPEVLPLVQHMLDYFKASSSTTPVLEWLYTLGSAPFTEQARKKVIKLYLAKVALDFEHGRAEFKSGPETVKLLEALGEHVATETVMELHDPEQLAAEIHALVGQMREFDKSSEDGRRTSGE